jgi:ATP-dependent exoDNAse (exonuclease V) beta subunit
MLKSNPAFEPLYSALVSENIVNRLNSLYVGFTRAEEELSVIGVRGKTAGYPLDLLPSDDFPPAPKPARAEVAVPAVRQPLPLLHHRQRIQITDHPDAIMSIRERKRGEFIHRILSCIEYIGDGFEEEITGIIRKVTVETGSDYPEAEIKNTVLAFLSWKKMQGYFMKKRGRTIRREQEFSDREGRLFRMDRVVIDRDTITVIDFKTGTDKEAEEKYRIQVKTYMNILRTLYSVKKVEGVIAYTDIHGIVRIA